MKQISRVLISLFVSVSTYYFIYWVPFSLIPFTENRWISSSVSLICAIGAGRYVWLRSGFVSRGLISCISYGALALGAIGFSAGFFGPMIFTPGANQGPLLGIFITGPLGFLLGGIGGLFYWFFHERKIRMS